MALPIRQWTLSYRSDIFLPSLIVGLMLISSLDSAIEVDSFQGGVAEMTIGYPPDTSRIYVYGYANASGLSQYFDNDILLLNEYQHKGEYSEGFEVDVTGGFKAPPAGQVMYRDCYGFHNATVWANKTIYCYVMTGFFDPNGHLRQLTHVDVYTCTTDENGKITLPVTVPAWINWEFDFDFTSATGIHPKAGENGSDHDSLDGLNYSSQGTSMGFDAPSPVFCESLDMHRGDLKLGAPVSVWGNASAQDLPLGMISWDFGDSLEMADWKVLVQPWHYIVLAGAQYCGTAVLPAFLPEGLNYSIYGEVENDIYGWQYDLASLTPNQTVIPTPAQPANRPNPPVFLENGICVTVGILIVLLALGAASVLWYANRKRPPGNLIS